MSAEYVEFYCVEAYQAGTIYINRNEVSAVKEYDSGHRPVDEASIYLTGGHIIHVNEGPDKVLEKIGLRYGARK